MESVGGWGIYRDCVSIIVHDDFGGADSAAQLLSYVAYPSPMDHELRQATELAFHRLGFYLDANSRPQEPMTPFRKSVVRTSAFLVPEADYQRTCDQGVERVLETVFVATAIAAPHMRVALQGRPIWKPNACMNAMLEGKPIWQSDPNMTTMLVRKPLSDYAAVRLYCV